MEKLGCKLFVDNHENMILYCIHPTQRYKIYFVPDACHNLKLCRNALATYDTFQYNDQVIRWEYVVNLYNFQSELTLKFIFY